MHFRQLPAEGFTRERWRNGAGWTRRILEFPGDGGPMHWRASIAEINGDCRYSPYPGCERLQALLSGEGATLRFDDGRELRLEPPHGRTGFAGDEAPACSVQGPVQAFNLMVAREHARAELLHRPLVGPIVFLPETGVQWLVLLLSGRATLPDVPNRPLLEAGDALLLWPEVAAPQRTVLTGGGELLLARIQAPFGAPRRTL